MPPFANLIPAKLGLQASLLALRIGNLFARRRIAKSGEAAEFFPAPFGYEVAKAGFVIGKVLKWARGRPLLTMKISGVKGTRQSNAEAARNAAGGTR